MSSCKKKRKLDIYDVRTAFEINIILVKHWEYCKYYIGVTMGKGPEFGRSVNPIQTSGADYAPHTTAIPSPGFKKLSS